MREGLNGHQEMGWKVWLPYRTALLADALRLAGEAEEGLGLLEQVHQGVEEREDLANESEILRIKGELLLSLPAPDPTRAEKAFRDAIQVARWQGARSYELRAATSLAEFLHAEGRRDEAREVLTEIYHWFTEGFDTPDLKGAARLLQSLEKPGTTWHKASEPHLG
jgi:predicted ATPase